MKKLIHPSTNMSVCLPAVMQEKLRQAAQDDHRSVSSLVAALVDAYLTREGYLYPGRENLGLRPVPRQSRIEFEY